MDRNMIKDEGGVALAQSLRQNTSLKELWFRYFFDFVLFDNLSLIQGCVVMYYLKLCVVLVVCGDSNLFLWSGFLLFVIDRSRS